MDISVIILAYNAVETIEKSIESVLCQKTDAEFEIILANDCSTDGTDVVCAEYASRYPEKIRYINRTKNVGLIENYFDCLNRAKGRYIADCSGDDYWMDCDRLQKLYESMASHPEITLCSSQWLCRNITDGSSCRPSNAFEPGYYERKKLLFDLLTNRKVVNLSSSLYRKNVVEQKLIKEPELFLNSDSAFEDLSIVMCCADEGDILVLPDVTLCYNVNPESVSNAHKPVKRYEFFSKALLQKLALKNFFINDIAHRKERALADYFKKEADYVMSLRFDCGPDIGQQLNTQWVSSFTLGFKGRLYFMLMRDRQIWRIAFYIKHSVLKRKPA